ncbi:MAG: hypothetical protein J6Y19_01190 [Kiritimatiellae bacterium]|nr:hypothetical protein [Kiritimatiellia bacterium]
MKEFVVPLSLGIATLVLVVGAFGTGTGDNPPAEDADDGVMLGEVDLAEQAEIWRNQYRRITPGDGSLVQDVGTLPAAWEEFSSVWDAAPAVRDLATWLVPFSAERDGAETILRDANGSVLWRGTTDFAKPESADVTLTGALVDELDWPVYDAAQAELAWRRTAEAYRDAGHPLLRDGEGGGTNNTPTNNPDKMFVSAVADFTTTPPEIRVGLLWTNDVTLDVFAYGPLHTSALCTITYTNDENQLVTTNVLRWYQVEPTLTGRSDNHWDYLGTVTLSNGEETVFVDTNYLPERWVVRYYSAFETGDFDNDGLNDAFETRILGTSTNSPDTDGDGIDDATEYASGAYPTISNVWWVTKTTNTLFDQITLPNCPSNAPLSYVKSYFVHGIQPIFGSIISNVTISGYIDDAIKVGTNFIDLARSVQTFSNRCITNELSNMYDKLLLLSLYDYPDAAHAGPNEVRIGASNDDPFRVEWTWLAPMDIRLEHVNTNGNPSVVNPVGAIPNREFTCQVTVLPEDFPDSNIFWSCTSPGMSFVNGVTNGRSVQLVGTQPGDWETSVTVQNDAMTTATLHGTILEKKTVQVYLHIVRDNDGANAAMTVEHFRELLHGANQIHEQSGIEFVLASPVLYTNKSAWLFISTNNDFEDYGLLQSWSSNTGGIEVYCINDFPDVSYNGLTRIREDASAGVTITTNATARTLAHEFGHVCGLPDIYDIKENFGIIFVLPTNLVQQAWLPQDWCGDLPNGGYGQLRQKHLLQRLLMYGYDRPDAVDLTAGTIFGLDHNGDPTNSAIGLSNMTREPHSW